ncbi:MAG TPA: T9SS type A sorting domain-containing protein [Saprospiraceae bacterium]|nr:T9SS type A sorting domain-containing protein [Saprospiraceae bacterium]
MQSKLNITCTTLQLLLLFCLSVSNLRAQWQSYTPALPDTVGTYDLRIAHGNNQVAWAVAMKYDVTPTTYAWVPMDSLIFAKTSDGGNTWTGGTIPMGTEPYANNISPISADTAWASGVDFNYISYIMHTVDGGQTWQRQLENGFASATSYIDCVHFWDAQNGIAIGDPAVSDNDTVPFFEIYTTSNGGQNWTRIGSDKIPATLPNEYGYAGDYFVVGDNVWFTTFNYSTYFWMRVFHSADRGATWTASNAQAGFVYFADELHGVARANANPNQALRYTDDGGATWTSLPPVQGTSISSLVIIPQSNYLLTVQRNNNVDGPFRTMLSTDLGQTWTEIGTGTEHAGNAKFSSPSVGYAGEWQPADHLTRMYKYVGNPLTGLFSGLTLDAEVSTSPNPTTDQLNVQIKTAEPAEFVLLLNDLQGRLIDRKTIEKTALGNAQFDVNGLPAGVYSLTVSSSKGYLTKKVVKQ